MCQEYEILLCPESATGSSSNLMTIFKLNNKRMYLANILFQSFLKQCRFYSVDR
jgi:hypothetical protein